MTWINERVGDKLLAFIAAVLAVIGYLFTLYIGKPDEFLKNIALIFAGAFVNLLRGESTSQIIANPKSGDTIFVDKTEKKEGD